MSLKESGCPWRRRLARAALVLLVAIAAALGYAAWRATRWPEVSGARTVAGSGLAAPIEIVRGPHGVPHVFAASAADAYFGMGYCQAQDRTLQLEIFRRASRSRLAEILGEEVLPIDRLTATLDFRGIAARQMEGASPRAKALAKAYTDGINAGLRSLSHTPPELALLGVQPEPWDPLDCMALARLLSWNLAEDHRAELLFARIRERIGDERAIALLPTSAQPAREDRALGPLPTAPLFADAARAARRVGLDAGAACSNWIVGGERSRSGKPLYGYDAHQGGARIPGEVYLIHLVGGAELDVLGGVIIGLPGIYAGVTRETAFSPTNLGGDAQDLFVLDVDPARPEHYRVAGESESLPFARRTVTIPVRGRKEPLRLDVRDTEFGPVVSELFPANAAAPASRVLALRWVGARPELRVDGYLTMPLARDWTEFRECLAAFETAGQHFSFAGADGTIAYQVIGPLPRRTAPSSPWPVAPASLAEAKPPLLTLDELPHLVRPPDGFIVTANHRPARCGKPYYLGRTYVPPARHDRYVEMLVERKEPLGLDDMIAANRDLRSAFASRMAPLYAKVLAGAAAADARWVGESLAAWDFRMGGAAVEPLLFHALWDESMRAILEDDLGDLLPEYLGRAEHSKERLSEIIESETSPFFDDARTLAAVETRAAIVERAALAGLRMLEGRLGKDRSAWRWDALHTVTLQHYVHGLTTALDQGPFPVAGDDDTPFRFGEQPFGAPFEVGVVSLIRLFADLGDTSAVHAAISTGQQGWPLHRHFKDQVPLWLKGDLIRIPRERDAILREAEAVLKLSP